ncbi:hypothetical protein ACQ4N7_16035 [Nodosilinea sp. AN01ver1]
MKFLQSEESILGLINSQIHNTHIPYYAPNSSVLLDWEVAGEWTVADYLGKYSLEEIRKMAKDDEAQELFHYLETQCGMDDYIDLEASDEGRKKLSLMRAWKLISDLDDSIETYRKQNFILIGTYFELITENFITVLFVESPEKMSGCLGLFKKDSGRRRGFDRDGRIPLKKILENESKESLINSLAIEASAEIMRRKNENIIDAINNLTRQSGKRINEEVVKKIIEVLNIRNQIVHENKFSTFSGYEGALPYYQRSWRTEKEYLELQALKVLEDFVVELGDICLRINMPQNFYPVGFGSPSLYYET